MSEYDNALETGLRHFSQVSVVLPCFNEHRILEVSVRRIRDILDASRFPYEIIFVDDLSTDGTQEIIKRLIAHRPNERALFHAQNEGRGKAVTDGIRSAAGEVVGFIDVDLEIDALYIPALALEVMRGADIAVARRVYQFNWSSLPRQMLSRIYVRLLQFLLKVSLSDTETGCKFFNRGAILPVLGEVRDGRWFWDTEIMVRSYYKGYRIKEIPALYVRKPEAGTTVKVWSDGLDYLKNLFAFSREIRELSMKKSAGLSPE
jgi:glycosyltransferase involved in cell wall biosynthesis